MMTRNDARLHQMLEAERAALQDSIGHYEVLTRHKKPGLGNHMADDATEVFDQASGLALHLNEQALLAQVDDALERMEKGDYGLCGRCGTVSATTSTPWPLKANLAACAVAPSL